MEGPDFLQWAVGQGVAVAVLAFVLIRLDARMQRLQESLDKLLAFMMGRAGDIV